MITGRAIIEYAGKVAVRDAASEAGQRAAVSRAYYGAFHLARAFLRSAGAMAAAKHDVHVYLQSCTHPPVRQIGHKLADLQSERIKADYDLGKFAPAGLEPQRFAQYCVEVAREIESLLDQCNDPQMLAAVKADVDRLLSARRRN